MNAERTFPVVEVFGPTVQGEGPETGLRVGFVRFGGCDYRCVWCDTDIAVLPEKVRGAERITADTILRRVQMHTGNVGTIILSGGNPALHDLDHLVDLLHESGYRVTIETQGSVWKDWIGKLDQVVVSPKPPSAGYGGTKSWTDLDAFMGGYMKSPRPPIAFKVPCLDDRDVSFAGEVADEFPEVPMFLSVVTMSGGLDGTFVHPPEMPDLLLDPRAPGRRDTPEDLLRRYEQIIDLTHANPHLRDARIIPQMHYLLWGHERGR